MTPRALQIVEDTLLGFRLPLDQVQDPPDTGTGTLYPVRRAGEHGGARALSLAWSRDILTLSCPEVPGSKVEIWYLEAYYRSGSRDRAWRETVIPHHTELVEEGPGGRSLHLRCRLPVTRDASGRPVDLDGAPVVVDHVIRASAGEVSFEVEARNRGTERVDALWAQPCIRAGGFTGGDQATRRPGDQASRQAGKQASYVEKCFIFTEGEMTPLPRTRRSEEARYRGGQVYGHGPREQPEPLDGRRAPT